MPRVAVVTDSTSDLSPDGARQAGIAVVPVQVVVNGQAYDEGAGISSIEVARALKDGATVTTSRPTPSAFLECYRGLAESGFDEVVSVHLSSELSSTYDSALMAAREVDFPVRVVDSRSISMGLGFAVLTAATVADSGGNTEDVVSAAVRSANGNEVLFYVNTLEFLRRGGRIGSAQRIIGQALAVKPLLHVADGRVEPLEKVRTRSRALARLLALAIEAGENRPCRFAVQHLDASESAASLAAQLQERFPTAEIRIGEVGAVIGTHVGPGMLSIIVSSLETG